MLPVFAAMASFLYTKELTDAGNQDQLLYFLLSHNLIWTFK